MKIELLKKYRTEALKNLRGIPIGEGLWTTEIDGVKYHAKMLGGVRESRDSTAFIRSAITDTAQRLRRNEPFTPDSVYLSTD